MKEGGSEYVEDRFDELWRKACSWGDCAVDSDCTGYLRGAGFGLGRFFVACGRKMKDMLKYLLPYWKGLIAATAAVAISTLCDLLLPTIMSQILNNGVYRADFPYIVKCCAVMAAVALVGLGTVILGAKISNDIVASFCADVRSAVFLKVNQMSFEEFGELGTAALVTRCTHDVETVSWIAAELSGTVITIPMLFFGGVVLSLRKDVALSLTMLAFVPAILAIVLYIGKRIDGIWEISDRYVDRQNEIMRERLRGIRVIRAFNAEPREHARVSEATRIMVDSFIRGNVAIGAVSPLATFLLNLAAVVIVYLGGWRMETSAGLTGADIFAIVQYVSLVSAGVITGAFAIISFPQAKVAAGRIGQVLHARGMADPIARQDITLAGDIVFDHVSFRYDGASEAALKDISLHIARGQKAAVIGGTGSGKSTLVQILLGFRAPTSGAVLLDGISTEKLSRRTIRDNISCVLQNATIYSGTIRENVRMGKLDASDAEIRSALETAQAGEFVNAYADGIDHEIRQSGKNLSGGQKQRLSIARALLKDAPIYIFDDSFSALDFLTEAKLRTELNRRLAGKTQMVITQRVTSAMHCDVIFVMDGGALVDRGTHGQLLERCGVYREIYASQTGGNLHEAKE